MKPLSKRLALALTASALLASTAAVVTPAVAATPRAAAECGATLDDWRLLVTSEYLGTDLIRGTRGQSDEGYSATITLLADSVTTVGGGRFNSVAAPLTFTPGEISWANDDVHFSLKQPTCAGGDSRVTSARFDASHPEGDGSPFIETLSGTVNRVL